MELKLLTVIEMPGEQVVLLSFPLPVVQAEGLLSEHPEAVEGRQKLCIEANL